MKVGIPGGTAGNHFNAGAGFLEYWNAIEQPMTFFKGAETLAAVPLSAGDYG